MDQDHMAATFPWILALSPADQESCTREFVDAVRAGEPHLVLSTLTSWQETATAVTAGLNSADLEWFDEDAAEIAKRPST